MNYRLFTLNTEKVLSEFPYGSALKYDCARVISSVQGLVNRDIPELYLLWQDADSFWLEFMMSEGKFLHGAKIDEINSFGEFLNIYGDFIRKQKLVAWDEFVPATLNAALTACGVDGFIPVRYDKQTPSAMGKLSGIGAEIALDLHGKFTGKGTIPDIGRPSSGSAKCDTYLWALDKYLDKTNTHLMFYTLDGVSWDRSDGDDSTEPYYPDLGNAFVFNHDYAISKRAFVFDVSSYGDELPCDDRTQPLGCDLATMKEILCRQCERTDWDKSDKMITVCGFNPWQMKYTDYHNKGKHGGVAAEWEFTEILSAYNCVKDADAYGYCGLANASAFTHYPLKEKYVNRKAKKHLVRDDSKTYILFYVGDYDAAAWTTRHIPMWAKDKKLGKNPLMWCFNPNLSDRVPMAFDYIYENFTDNDYFEAGDSGAGYNNPYLLYEPRIHSDLPDASELYVRHNKHYFDKFDMHIIGFIINGIYPTDEKQMRDIAKFADEGSGYNNGKMATSIVNGAVYMPHSHDISIENTDPKKAASAAVAGLGRFEAGRKFHIFRTILTSPTLHDQILEEMKALKPEANFELVDPHTFFRFAKEAAEICNGD